MKTALLLVGIVFVANSAWADRCYIYGNCGFQCGSYYPKISSGVTFQYSQDLTPELAHVGEAIQKLQVFQKAGVCPAATDPNPMTCYFYSSGDRYKIAVGENWASSRVLAVGRSLEEVLNIATSMRSAGQCKSVEAGHY